MMEALFRKKRQMDIMNVLSRIRKKLKIFMTKNGKNG